MEGEAGIQSLAVPRNRHGVQTGILESNTMVPLDQLGSKSIRREVASNNRIARSIPKCDDSGGAPQTPTPTMPKGPRASREVKLLLSPFSAPSCNECRKKTDNPNPNPGTLCKLEYRHAKFAYPLVRCRYQALGATACVRMSWGFSAGAPCTQN